MGEYYAKWQLYPELLSSEVKTRIGFVLSIKHHKQIVLWNVFCLLKFRYRRCCLFKVVLLCKAPSSEWRDGGIEILAIIDH